jgi:hypothetical protein
LTVILVVGIHVVLRHQTAGFCLNPIDRKSIAFCQVPAIGTIGDSQRRGRVYGGDSSLIEAVSVGYFVVFAHNSERPDDIPLDLIPCCETWRLKIKQKVNHDEKHATQ